MTTSMTERPVMVVTRAEAAEAAALLELRVTTSPRPCAGGDPDDWYPPHAPCPSPDLRATLEARAHALCLFCPVTLDCLELAMHREAARRRHGVWGGLMPWQRDRLAMTRALGELAAAPGMGVAS
jgi:hypothetical protein